MYRLCCDITPFAARNLREGLAAADLLRINDIALGCIDGKPLQDCTGEEIENIRSALIDSNKTIVEQTMEVLGQWESFLKFHNRSVPCGYGSL